MVGKQLPGQQDFDLAAWLRDLGLERYARAFLDAEVTLEVLLELTDADLRELGLPLGPRKAVLKATHDLARPAASRTGAGPSLRPAPPEAERRQLTVVFFDLVGSTALSARLDPEEMRETLCAYQDAVAGEIARLGGHVANFLGDGVLAYFGWPRAHEDDAERAVRAGLTIAGAIGRLITPAGEPLAVRVGIATGLVVVGGLADEGATREEAVVGETPNLAARLQALAEPGGVVISDLTRRLVGGLFELEDLGSRTLKGIGLPVHAFAVADVRAAEDRFAAHQSGAPLPLIGRNQELALLLDLWRLAKGSVGQVVLLSGEPGIGKSRIVLELRERLRAEEHTSVRYNCSAFHRNSALHPAIEQLTWAAGFAPGDEAATRLVKLEALVAQATAAEEVAPYLADLLGLPADGRHTLPPLTPQETKARSFRALLAQLEGLAQQNSVLLVLEDAHWCDPTTLELFDRVVERIVSLPVLLVVTFRPEFRPPWAARHPHVTSLPLNRLGPAEARAIVDRVAGGRELPEELLAAIVARTDGVPLFVEELTKAVLEAGLLRDEGDRYVLRVPLPLMAIPDTLHGSLLARLDRLGSVRTVAQTAAAIGREFPHKLLAAVAPLSKDELEEALAQLVKSELISRRGVPPEATYTFKHALVRDAAYESLLRSRRQELHARIAEILERQLPETVDLQPELLAHHYTEAGLAEQAIHYWRRAGARAAERSANLEAVVHLRKGLELLGKLPEGAERARRELGLQVALGGALISTKGYAAPETGQAYARAHQLCGELGESPLLFPALYGQYVHHEVRSEFAASHAYAQELLRLGQEKADPVSLLVGHRIVGASLFYLGRPTVACTHLEQAVALYVPEEHRSLALVYGYDARVVSRFYLLETLFVLGYPDRALALCREALAEAHGLSPGTLAYALNHAGYAHHFRREREPVRMLAEELVLLAKEQSFPYWLAAGTILKGWALADGGRSEAGIAALRHGIEAWRATGAELYMPYHLALLSEAEAKGGQSTEALSRLAEALARATRTGEGWFDAELHRLKGRVLSSLHGGDPAEAEGCFRQALEVARGQGARMWELRAAADLARLLAAKGERAEARDLLAPIYGWFTEGFDTPDLREAEALLQELS
jgi:class 3 adenylate cyclase/predicted ATPase